MATRKQSTQDETNGESTVVKVTDTDGRVHYTARNSPFVQSLGDDVTVEAVTGKATGSDASADAR